MFVNDNNRAIHVSSMASQLGVLGEHHYVRHRHVLICEYGVGLAGYSVSYRTILCHALVELDRHALHCGLYAALLWGETSTSSRSEAINHDTPDWKLALVYLYFDAFCPTDHTRAPVLS